MDPSRTPRAGLSLLLFCALVGGGVGVAGPAVGSDRPGVAGPTTTTVDVADGSFDSTPAEDAQTTETATPEENETATPTPTETPESDDSTAGRSTPTDDGTPKEGGGANGSDGTDGSDADAESRDPNEFEEAAESEGSDGTNDPDATHDAADESRDDAPEVEARSRRRMPTRGPERGTIVVAFDDVPVSTVSFTRRQWGNVTVEVLDGLPSGVEAPTGDRLSTLRITVPEEIRDDPAKVMFTVDVATLDARGVPNDAVWLAHHDPDTGEWDRLETHVVHATDGRVTYAANTPGFSLFAIQGDGSQVRSPTSTESAIDSGTGSGDVTATAEAEAAIVGGFGLSMGVVLFMGAVSVVTTVLGARRVEKVEPPEGS